MFGANCSVSVSTRLNSGVRGAAGSSELLLLLVLLLQLCMVYLVLLIVLAPLLFSPTAHPAHHSMSMSPISKLTLAEAQTCAAAAAGIPATSTN